MKHMPSSSHIMIHLDGNEGGGIRTVSEAWFRGFTERGIRISFIMNRHGDYASYLQNDDREVYCVYMGKLQSRSWHLLGRQLPDLIGWVKSFVSTRIARTRFENILQEFKPDVVLGNGASSAAVIGPACKKCGIKLVCCFHGVSNSSDLLSVRKRAIAYLVNRYCFEIVGVSWATLASIVPYLSIPHRVIYNSVTGIDVSVTNRQRLRNTWNISSSTIVFGCASRIAASRAIHRFVDAAKAFMATNQSTPVIFLIAGAALSKNDQVYLDSILSKIKQDDLQEKIRYVGFQPISHYYSVIDVFCHTLEGVEGLGLSILEALSAGLPIITCDKGGYLEFLPDNIGIRYDGSSHIQLAEAMQKMLDVSYRTAQSEMGRRFFFKEYPSYSRWLDSWVNVLFK